MFLLLIIVCICLSLVCFFLSSPTAWYFYKPNAMQCNSTGAEAAYGLCYGTKTSHPRTPAEVVEIYRSRGISKMWLSPTPSPPSANSNVISIPSIIRDDSDLRSKIKIVMCIDYKDLSPLANYTNALEWVRTYVGSCASVISHVCVGDVIGSVDFPIPIFKDAMRNLKKLLPETVKLSVFVTEFMLLGNAYTALNPPSTCNIETSRSTDILLFLSKHWTIQSRFLSESCPMS